MESLPAISELLRRTAPGPEPLGMAFDGPTLWIASREAHRLYAVDPVTWQGTQEVECPGAPFGIAVGAGELRVVIGFGEDDDDRYAYRFVPGHGFDRERIECPDLSGVHLAVEGDTLFLSQAHNHRILALDTYGGVMATMQLDRVPVGMTLVGGSFYLITGDDRFKNLQLGKLEDRAQRPRLTALATIPFVARGLAFDGARFWTGDRTANEIVAFGLP